MSKLAICGGKKINGTLKINSAKNAVLPIISATLLTDEKIVIKNVPDIVDVKKMLDIIICLGGKVQDLGDGAIEIDNSGISSFEIPSSLTSEIRSSIFIMGPMLAKFKKVKVAYPGGCDIGSRPIDLHLSGLRELNATIHEEYGFINCEGENMKSKFVHLDFPSVGATENIMMASVFLDGETTIYNPAKEPEIVDLANFINAMGGRVYGAGSSVITIYGVKKLHGTTYSPIGDRIVAGTYIIASAITCGHIELENISFEHVLSLIDKLSKSGCNIETKSGKIIVDTKARIQSCSFDTQPYPGFPTDLQPQMSALLSVACGTSIVTENLFETRFKHFSELVRMGAKITSRDRTAIIKGVSHLYGAEVTAYDLRGGAALVLAGLVAKGETVVDNVKYIDRGYVDIEKELASLGADIKRIL